MRRARVVEDPQGGGGDFTGGEGAVSGVIYRLNNVDGRPLANRSSRHRHGALKQLKTEEIFC